MYIPVSEGHICAFSFIHLIIFKIQEINIFIQEIKVFVFTKICGVIGKEKKWLFVSLHLMRHKEV